MTAAEQTFPETDRDDTAIEALLGRCAARDRAAFAELYRAVSPKLLACLIAILRRRDQAEVRVAPMWRDGQPLTRGSVLAR